MAVSDKSKTKKKSASSKSSAKKPPQKTTPAPAAPEPHRREAAAVVFLLLAVFLIISYFTAEGTVIVFATRVFQGLIGWGYWLLAPTFLILAFILGFHHGRPVAWRVFCVLMLPLLFAALGQILLGQELKSGTQLSLATGTLYLQGQELASGGVFGGLLGVWLQNAFSKVGGVLILLLFFGLFLVCGLRLNVKGAAGKLKERLTVPYEPEPERPAPSPVKKEPELVPEAKPEPRKESARRQRSASVDLPLGEEEETLPLRELSEPEELVFQKPKATKAKVRKKPAEPQPEPQPATKKALEELEDVDDASFVEFPVTPQRKQQSVPAVAEINDPPKKKPKKEDIDKEAAAVSRAVESAGPQGDYVFPPLNLLRGGSGVTGDYRDEVLTNRERLEGALHSFGINAGIVGVIRGPTVTRYDIELEQGVKLSRVTNLAGDLALALGVVNVRIAPIPDKISTVGIEVPNKIVSTVYLRDILESPRFTDAKSRLSFALGKDIGGDCIVGNIAKLPHMLIAGTTGSGKSVCMNSLILSLLYKARPDEVRLIMIDPKMVELGIYNGIPHLYVPVVTDPKKAAGALQWSVVEMLKRYRAFSEVGVRDLAAYNKHCDEAGEPRWPQVVIVIDELADLMMIASKEVEESICRVAQMGRAAGMHLVIATQRPSADVITGLMKANIPSRIAFAVSSAMESRIILDQAGAEKLVGMGDMLFAPVGSGKPTRIQGAFVSDEEREQVVQFIKENSAVSQASQEIEEYMNKAAADKKGGEGAKEPEETSSPAGDYDEMLSEAVEAVLEMKSCSVSMLQRRVKLGYSRAARIVDQMEELGVVGPYEGAKPRSVLIDRNQWQQLKVQLGLASESELSLAQELSQEAEDEDDENY